MTGRNRIQHCIKTSSLGSMSKLLLYGYAIVLCQSIEISFSCIYGLGSLMFIFLHFTTKKRSVYKYAFIFFVGDGLCYVCA